MACVDAGYEQECIEVEAVDYSLLEAQESVAEVLTGVETRVVRRLSRALEHI